MSDAIEHRCEIIAFPTERIRKDETMCREKARQLILLAHQAHDPLQIDGLLREADMWLTKAKRKRAIAPP